jgi:hypothetical protein
VFSIFAVAFLLLVLDSHKVWLSTIAIAFLGFSIIPIIGNSFSFCAEIAYPIDEGISCAIINILCSVVATAFTYLFNYILDVLGGFTALGGVGGLVVIGTIASLFIKEELNKTHLKLSVSSSSFGTALVPEQEYEEMENEEDMKHKENSSIQNENQLKKSLKQALVNKDRNGK